MFIKSIWLRRDGDKLRVLFEHDGKTYVGIEESWPGDGEGEISHCLHESGMQEAVNKNKKDPLFT